ncbi:MAG: hypothetical protein QXU79_01520 [Candidatus Micrarchaeaceae archaeon]
MSKRVFIELNRENLEDIQIPDIQTEPLPEISPEIPKKPPYITITNYLDILLNSIIKLFYEQQTAPLWEAFIWGIMIRALLIIYGIVWLLQPIFDPLIISMQDILWDLYIAFIQFKNAVEKDYQGDWIRGVLELTLRVILLQTLSSALNIPSINQLWTLLKNGVNGIINELNSLTNEINEGLNILADWFESVIGEIPEWLQYILQEQIRNLRQEFNTLLNQIQSAFIREINEFKQTYFRDIDTIKKWIDSVDNEIKQFRQNLEPSIREILTNLATPVGWESVWNFLRELFIDISTIFQTTEFIIYGSIAAVISAIKTWSIATTEVDLTSLLKEIVDDVIYGRGNFIIIANQVASEIDDIFTKYQKQIPNRIKIAGLTEQDIDIVIR